jgi:outer membrane protein insertion porin family
LSGGKAVVRQLTIACGKARLFRLRRCLKVSLVALLACSAGPGALSTAARQNTSILPQGKPQQDTATIEQINFEGNRRIRRNVLEAKIFSRAGDVYNAALIDKDYHSLWNTGYFDDVFVTVEDSTDKPNAKIVTFHVLERPTIRRIEYKGNKSVSESDILDRFKEAKLPLTQDSQFDATKIKKAEVLIKELLGEHGRQFATVKATYQKIAATNAVILTFNIEEGAKVQVGKITFTGNHAFSSRRLIRTMKRSRPYGFDAKLFAVSVMSKTFDKEKLDEDMEVGLRGFYQDNGYFEVLVDIQEPPGLQTVDVYHRGIVKGPIPIINSTHGKVTNIPIKIVEGELFRMGKIYIVNADPEKGLQLKHDFLVNAFPLKQGDVLNVDRIRKAIEQYTKLYGQFGFMDFTATPNFDIDRKNKVVNVTLRFSEEKPYYIHRINITGNTTTRDKIIRRELLLDEGDLYNNRNWEVSILRLNQLGFFDQLKPETAANVVRNVKAGTVDLNLKVKEKQKQSITFTGGVSGIAGSFLSLGYQTNNFLGLGETLTLSTQFGTVQRDFRITFSEPYLFDKQIATGISLFSSRYNFDQARQTSLLLGQQISLSPAVAENYNQNSKGINVFASHAIKRWSHYGQTRFALAYGYSDTNIQPFSPAATLLFTAIQFQSVAGPSALNGIHSSSITSTLSYNSVDNPINAHKGKNIFYAFKLEGGPLGGNTKSITNTLSIEYYHPTYHNRNTIALRFLGTFASSFSGSELPPFERTFAGGENTLRTFDIQTVSPIAFIPVATTQTLFYTDPTRIGPGGTPLQLSEQFAIKNYTISFPGGDTMGILNAEYRIPLYTDKVSFSFYTDIGSVGALQRDQLNLNATGLASLATAFPNSPNPARLPLAPGSNFIPRASAGAEIVIQLPIVQAPFRLYWGYDYLRYNRQIVAPVGDFYITPEQQTRFGNGPGGLNILNTLIIPQLTHAVSNPAQFRYTDPLKTLRFTVSRTF